MADGPPDTIAIDPDDYHAEHVGRTADGRQFFLTTPFDPAIGGRAGSEFVALYLFDATGKLLETRLTISVRERSSTVESAAKYMSSDCESLAT